MTAYSFNEYAKQIKQQTSQLALNLQFQIADLFQFIIDHDCRIDSYWLERNSVTIIANVNIDGIEVNIQETI